VGFGGVWVGAAPYFMFIPMKDGDEPKPAGPPQILLDGWNYNDTHETLNTFTWGPDGWLYGCHGVFNLSKVGKPGTPDKDRTIVTCGIWRYHPIKHTFEYFSEGTSNPWGVDFDEHGQCFIEACVIPHLWHMIQGAHYMRQGGNHVNPYVFDDIKTIADHLHYAGGLGSPHAANGRSAEFGGGHAHAGMMVYQGGSWPQQYWGQLFMNNVHGFRMNMDIPERQGSGFVGHHGKDFILYNDSWSQVIDMQSDQDGSMYMIDWYDAQRCHINDPKAIDRSNGRIYKVVYGDTKWTPVDLQKKSDGELIELQLSKNDWYARHARRILEERASSNTLASNTIPFLRVLLDKDPFPTGDWAGPNWHTPENQRVDSKVSELRFLWTLHDVGGLNEAFALKNTDPLNNGDLFNKSDEYIRAWTIQLLLEDKPASSKLLKELLRMAKEEKSPVVRLYIASALQRIPVNQRWDIVAALDKHGEDAKDHNLPLMYWYAAEPLATVDIDRALKLAESSKIPRMLNFTVRRVAAIGTPVALASITKTLLHVADDRNRLDVLDGLSTQLRGLRKAAMPQGWDAVENKFASSVNADIRAQVQSLSLLFGSRNALASLRKTLMDDSADEGARHTALTSLLAAHDPELAPLLQQLLRNPGLQGAALRGLAAYDNPKTPQAILAIYPGLDPGQKRDALNTLVARVDFAKPLLAAVAQGNIPAKDLTADLVRQLRGLKDKEIAGQILKLWGVSRDSSAQMKADIEHYKQLFWAGGSVQGNASRGRAVFAKTCQQCHTLFGTGGHVGPDLTGSQRANLDYIVLNIVDPNAVIPNDYRASILEMKDGRSITGIVTKQDDKSLTVVTANETLVLPRNEVDSQTLSPNSMMPEGLLQQLSDQEVRDLLYYLGRPGQVPFPTVSEVPADPATFFDGKDLKNWDGDTNLWRVENGEIIGSTRTGLKHNEFLKSRMALDNFRLILKIKLTPNKENSGIQFRSERFGDYEMRGPQADVGLGWWGKLYEENGRAILSNKPGDPYVNVDDWNTYEILAVDSKVRTAINGHLCVDVDDPKIARSGITGLQMHAGGPMEVRFKDFQLELNPKFEMKTVESLKAGQ
ncbi:MAG TPA: PVC-type heme-binding CxxCH protein, partial [Verrucomicrobiae bacterium]|nr:PVC-type heme-binding CxxCH protein [Verrucomicrobiae bacterium]